MVQMMWQPLSFGGLISCHQGNKHCINPTPQHWHTLRQQATFQGLIINKHPKPGDQIECHLFHQHRKNVIPPFASLNLNPDFRFHFWLFPSKNLNSHETALDFFFPLLLFSSLGGNSLLPQEPEMISPGTQLICCRRSQLFCCCCFCLLVPPPPRPVSL